MVVVIFDALLETLKTAETPDNLENLIGVTGINGVVRIKHGTASLYSKSHWLKGFDRNGVLLCFISSVHILDRVF
jgi:hypothetical protein